MDINLGLEEIKEKSTSSYKRLVNVKAKDEASDSLMEKHSQIEGLHYIELKTRIIQDLTKMKWRLSCLR